MTNRVARSSKYQWAICEIPCSDDFMSLFDNTRSYQGFLNPFHYSEEVLQLQDQLIKMIWQVIDQECTKKQKVFLNLYFKEGLTQIEIAKKLNINQSSVVKAFSGNTDYRNGKKVFGGIFKKLRRILSNNQDFISLYLKIKELRQEKE